VRRPLPSSARSTPRRCAQSRRHRRNGTRLALEASADARRATWPANGARCAPPRLSPKMNALLARCSERPIPANATTVPDLRRGSSSRTSERLFGRPDALPTSDMAQLKPQAIATPPRHRASGFGRAGDRQPRGGGYRVRVLCGRRSRCTNSARRTSGRRDIWRSSSRVPAFRRRPLTRPLRADFAGLRHRLMSRHQLEAPGPHGEALAHRVDRIVYPAACHARAPRL